MHSITYSFLISIFLEFIEEVGYKLITANFRKIICDNYIMNKSSESKSSESKSCDNSYKKLLHDIRNMKSLTNEQKKTIKNFTNSELVDLIFTYNDIVNNLIHILDCK